VVAIKDWLNPSKPVREGKGVMDEADGCRMTMPDTHCSAAGPWIFKCQRLFLELR
jgi:hypothetical protein